MTYGLVHTDLHDMVYKNGVLYLGTDGGLYKSNDFGVSWIDLWKGLAITEIYRIAGTPKDPNLKISRRLRESLSGFGALELICERLGCFPHPRYPRVVWAWVHDQSDERLAELNRRIDNAVAAFAEQSAEARFVGHITLARPKLIKRDTAEKLKRFLDEAVAMRFGTWPAEGVELIRSELSAQGSRYTTLDVFSL
jgi:2'-5' RNA ligase